MNPLCVELFAGMFGWGIGFAAEGYRVVGFDIEHLPRHGAVPAGCSLAIQDVRTLDGRQFKNAAAIVASPPCQAYSYRAMPWKRAKELPPPSNELFDACFRIQREAVAAAGRHIPLIVENVRGAQPWVGRAVCRYGSFYLWGDVPALMPNPTQRELKNLQRPWFALQHGKPDLADPRSITRSPSKSEQRKAHSAAVAKIPFELARHVARTFKNYEDPCA